MSLSYDIHAAWAAANSYEVYSKTGASTRARRKLLLQIVDAVKRVDREIKDELAKLLQEEDEL